MSVLALAGLPAPRPAAPKSSIHWERCPVGHAYAPELHVLKPGQIVWLLRKAGVKSRTEIASMLSIARRESSLNPNMHDPRSTAYGLYGFLNSTWRSVGVEKTRCPLCQTEAAVAYVEDRYGSAKAALNQWTPERGY